MHRAHHVAVRGQGFGIRHARDAEIADFHLTRAGNHHVLRLYIPVDDAPLMSVPQRRQNLQGEAHRVFLRNAAGLGNQFFERLPVHVFHCQIGYVADLARVDQIHDVRVAQLAANLALAPEPLLIFGVFRVFLAKHLDGDGLVRLEVKRAVDNRHAAPADDILHAKTAADDFTDQSRLHGLPSSPVQRISVTLSLPPASSAISTRRLAA